MHPSIDVLLKGCCEKLCQFHKKTSMSILGIVVDLQWTDSVLGIPGWLGVSEKVVH